MADAAFQSPCRRRAAMSARVVLPARLDLPAAAPLVRAILEHEGRDLVLEAGAVTHLGTPGLQVLLSAARTWQESGAALSLEGASERVAEQIGLFGLSPDDLTT